MRRFSRRSIEVSWTRTRTPSAGARETIRVRRGPDGWQKFDSADEMPADVRELLDDFLSGKSHFAAGAISKFDEEPAPAERRPGRRRPARVTDSGESLRLEHPWFDGYYVFIAVFGTPALLYWAWDAWSEGSRRSGGVSEWHLFWAGLFLLLAVTAAFWGLATLVNRTTFTIEGGRLKVRHGPIPWPGGCDLDAADIRQLYCSVFAVGGRSGRSLLRWRLEAVVDGTGHITLLDHIRSKDEAVSLERAIERHLGIPDWPRYGDSGVAEAT